MAFKPNDTQELIARNDAIRARLTGGDTDRHFRQDVLWEAMKNNDDATREIDKRLVELETTLRVLKWVIFTALPTIMGFVGALHWRIA